MTFIHTQYNSRSRHAYMDSKTYVITVCKNTNHQIIHCKYDTLFIIVTQIFLQIFFETKYRPRTFNILRESIPNFWTC